MPLKELTNPFEEWPWLGDFSYPPPLTRKEVAQAILDKQLEATPYPGPTFGFGKDWTREQHVSRVAYLCLYPSEEPVLVDVQDLGWVEVIDGHHRIAAAHFLGRTTILCGVSGYIDELDREFDESAVCVEDI